MGLITKTFKNQFLYISIFSFTVLFLFVTSIASALLEWYPLSTFSMLYHLFLLLALSLLVFPYIFECGKVSLSDHTIKFCVSIIWYLIVSFWLLQFCYFNEAIIWLMLCFLYSWAISPPTNTKIWFQYPIQLLNYLVSFWLIYGIFSLIIFNPYPEMTLYKNHIQSNPNFISNCSTIDSNYYSYPWFCKFPQFAMLIDHNTPNHYIYTQKQRQQEFFVKYHSIDCNFTTLNETKSFDLDLVCLGFHRFKVGNFTFNKMDTNQTENEIDNGNILKTKIKVNWIAGTILFCTQMLYFTMFKCMIAYKTWKLKKEQEKLPCIKIGEEDVPLNIPLNIPIDAIPMYIYDVSSIN